jgi:CheY-like chemotaxis protein
MPQILLVDDDDSFRKMLRIMLQQLKCEVSESRSGDDAIRKFTPEFPDILIIDVMMPGRLGVEMIAAFRVKYPGIRIVVMSDAGRIVNTEYLKIVLTLGADAVLEKPFSSDKLAATLAQLHVPGLLIGQDQFRFRQFMPRILLVDDDQLFRTMLRIKLVKMGYLISEARHGREALALFKEKPTDLVITDLVMPDMEGLETIREFKQRHSGVKIIAMSGGGRGSSVSYLKMAGGLGAHRVLSKPFTDDELRSCLDDVLGKPSSGNEKAPA